VTPQFEIRLATPSDAPAVLRIYAPVVTETAISFEEQPPSADEMAQRIDDVTREFPWLVATSAGEVVGYAYASRHRVRAAYRWDVDVSAYVDSKWRGRGIASALYRRLFDIVLRQNFVNAFAGITLPNAASVGLHESLGFKAIGTYRNAGFKQGRWWDVGWWQLQLRDLPATPQPLRTLAAVLGELDPEKSELIRPLP
jgi:L-amino acid N-acyltransferase YncA